MPHAIGENIPVTFACFCCNKPVQIWAFVPVHPDTSNTELLPEHWRKPYRQDWYFNPDGNRTFDSGQLFQLEYADGQPVLTAVALAPDVNPYVAGLVRIPEEGTGTGQVFWICAECHDAVTRHPANLWEKLLHLSE